MSLRRPLELLYMDLWDALRPPAFDIMLLVVAILAGALTVLQPVSSGMAAMAPSNGFNPVYLSLFVTTIYIALRSSSDLVNVIQSGVMQVYMSYPVSRRAVAAVLYVTRSLIPAVLLLGLPALIMAIILYPVVLRNPAQYLALWASYLLQSQMYGAFFLLLSTRLRSPGAAMVASVSFYFSYIAFSTFLGLLGIMDGIGPLLRISNAMGFYYAIYYYMTMSDEPAWIVFVVPALFMAFIATYFTYVIRGFEPT
ncbi:MAG: hypothetical protein ACP5HK_02905 [Acidilobus sp.]